MEHIYISLRESKMNLVNDEALLWFSDGYLLACNLLIQAARG